MKCVTFSPDGRWLVSGGADGVIRIWDHAARQLVLTQPAHKNTVYGVAFNADGTQLASSGFDRTICVWNVIAG
jgi:WD40 repeat protein